MNEYWGIVKIDLRFFWATFEGNFMHWQISPSNLMRNWIWSSILLILLSVLWFPHRQRKLIELLVEHYEMISILKFRMWFPIYCSEFIEIYILEFFGQKTLEFAVFVDLFLNFWGQLYQYHNSNCSFHMLFWPDIL